MLFLHDFQPEMIGIGPFIPHKDTPFRNEKAGSVELTLFLLSLLRLQHPNILLPATTALETLEHKGREKGILSGANVIMPNITPEDMRKKYLLYNNKYNGSLKENILQSPLQQQMQDIGYEIVIDRGNYCV
jgi:biotin synthase